MLTCFEAVLTMFNSNCFKSCLCCCKLEVKIDYVMKTYVLSLALSFMGGIAFGQIKLKEHRPLLQDKRSQMPVIGLDTTSAKYNMPVKRSKNLDSLAPMPGTEKLPKRRKSSQDTLRFKLLEDSLKVKDFKLKIDSLYRKK
jgi:hypothetical protein